MNLFINENEAQGTGTCSGNEANPGAQGVQPVGLGDAIVRLAMTGVAFGLGSHLFHRSQVWCDSELKKQDMRFKGEAPEVHLGKAQRATEKYRETETKAKTEAKAAEEKKGGEAKEKKAMQVPHEC